jgi:hypothetical protein
MILLCLPFAGAHRYFLLTPCVLLGLCLCIARVTGNIFYAALFIGLLCTSLSFWEIMIVGSDMIAIGFLFSIITILLYSCKPANRTGTVLLMLFAGIAATVRVIFIGLIPVWAFFIYRKNKRTGFTFLAVAVTAAIALHLLFYFLDPHAYTPLHVVRKGGVIMKPLIYAAGLLITVCAGVWIFLRTGAALSSWARSLGIACAAPLACVALGDIIRIQGNLSAWQGANYCSVFIPMFYLFYILGFAERRMEKERDESLRIDKQRY